MQNKSGLLVGLWEGETGGVVVVVGGGGYVVTWVGVRVRNGFWYVGTPTAYWVPGILE